MPSPFVIPGVTLEEVLGAARNTHGRRLYSLAATAAKDLADYVRDRRNDGDLEPVELVGAPAADPPAAAGAPPPASGTVSRSTADLEALLTDRGRDVLAALRAVAGEWRAPRDLAEALDVKVDLLTGALRDLRLAGLIEHNGKLRTASRVRVPAAPAPPASVPYPVPIGPDGEPDVAAARAELEEAIVDSREQAEAKVRAQDNGGYRGATITTPTHNVSRRVRRELEAEEQRRRREAERPPATNGAGTLDGQALQRLALFPSTIPELAVALGVHRSEAAAVIRRLEDDGDLHRAGRRGGEVIYAGEL